MTKKSAIQKAKEAAHKKLAPRFGVDLATTDQSEPTGDGEPVVPKVIADLETRQEMGRDKYGTVLRTHNGRDALVDAYQEGLDLVCYLRQLLQERDHDKTLADW